jgi:hypothetical protein
MNLKLGSETIAQLALSAGVGAVALVCEYAYSEYVSPHNYWGLFSHEERFFRALSFGLVIANVLFFWLRSKKSS